MTVIVLNSNLGKYAMHYGRVFKLGHAYVISYCNLAGELNILLVLMQVMETLSFSSRRDTRQHVYLLRLLYVIHPTLCSFPRQRGPCGACPDGQLTVVPGLAHDDESGLNNFPDSFASPTRYRFLYIMKWV